MVDILAGVILFFIFVPIIIELWEIIIVCLVGSAFVLFIVYLLIEQPLQQGKYSDEEYHIPEGLVLVETKTSE
jgi:hypothetical protein